MPNIRIAQAQINPIVGDLKANASMITRDIKRAREAGVKFTFGTNNGGAKDLGRMDYAIEMIRECGLTPEDLWMPEN